MFDAPLSDAFDAALLNPPGTTVTKYSFAGRIEQVGLESLRVVVPAQDKPISEAQFTLLRMGAVSDGWVRDVVSVDTHNSTTFGSTVKRVTVDNVHIRHTVPFTAPARPADFAISGTQILIDRSSVTGEGIWPVVTQVGVTGPNVVLNFRSTVAGIAPHQRWATGLLVDSSEFTGGPIAIRISPSRIERTPARTRMERRLVGGMERQGGSPAGAAASWLEELVHRLHRPVHPDSLARRPDRHPGKPLGDARVARRRGDAGQPVSRPAARSSR